MIGLAESENRFEVRIRHLWLPTLFFPSRSAFAGDRGIRQCLLRRIYRGESFLEV